MVVDKKKESEANHYEERVVAFIDILGFSDLVNQSFNSDTNETIIDGFNKIKRTLEVIRESFEVRQLYEKESWDVSLFSDSIIISFPINQRSKVFDILLALIYLTVDLLKDKIVCRGAIVRGFCYHDKEMVFGPAVIEAVRLERKATYPRIIVEQHVLQTGVEYHAKQNTREDEYKYIKEMIKKDCDGQFFIDYFTGALSEFDPPEVDNAVTYISWLRSIIVENLNKENVDERVLAKYIWMRNKFNESYIHICSNETIEQLIEGEHMNPEDLKGLKLIECK